MPVSELLQRAPADWERATRHPFLAAVRNGTLPPAAFDTWLVQDFRFVSDLLRFQARLLGRAPRRAQAVLVGGTAALVTELDWFEEQAAARGLDLDAPPLPATVGYGVLLERLDGADVASALTALWVVERAYLDAWSSAAPGAPAYREYVAHWTTPEFVAYVDALEAAANAEVAAGQPTDLGGVVAAVIDAECAFWDMALPEDRA